MIIDLPAQVTKDTRNALRVDILARVERERPPRVVLNFTGVQYVDSSGLGMLITLQKRARDHGTEVALAALSDELRTLLELTRLDTHFIIFSTLAEAS